MEGNKDESEKCIELAEKYINSGNREKALKFLNKAEKLYPSPKAKGLIELLQKLNGTTNWNQNSSQNGDVRQRHNAKEAESTEKVEEKKDYTPEQLAAVRKIKKGKDYYEILGVSKDCSENDLKKQYRKLALQFHPDKNKAPGAAEAFKAIGNAFSVLSDADKKRKYDLYGTEDPSSRQSSREYYDYTRGFESDVTPEELFNMFFGGGRVYMQRGSRTRTRFQQEQQHHAQNESSGAGYGVLLQLMPFLILVFLSMMSNFFVSDPAFSLTRTSKYIFPRTTQNLKVNYFVKKDFEELYKGGNVRKIEQEVEEDYVQHLRASCFRERNYKESMLWRARSYNSKDLYNQANSLRTPSCEKLQELYD